MGFLVENFMKRLTVILFFVFLAILLSGQGLFKPVPANLFSQDKYTLNATVSTSQWIPRIEVGLTGVSYELNSSLNPVPLSAVCFGFSWLHYKNVDNLPFNDFGINVMFLQDTQTKGTGIGFYGTYNTGLSGNNTLLNIGTHYDFVLNKEYIDTGLTWHF